MADEKKLDYISKISIGDVEYALDATLIKGEDPEMVFQGKSNLVQTISAESKTEEYPSAACMWNEIGDIKSILETI